MKNVVNRALVAKKNKFLSKPVPRGTRTIWRYLSALILLFSLSIGQMWGAETELFSSFANTTASNYFKSYTVDSKTVTVATDKSISSSSGDYFVQLGSTPSNNASNYIELSVSGATIKTISVKITGNGANKTCQPALLGWEGAVESNTTADYVLVPSSVVVSNKGVGNAVWHQFDVHGNDLTRVRIYRAVKGTSVAGADAQTYGNGQTLQFYGIRVELESSCTAPTNLSIGGDGEYAVGTDIGFEISVPDNVDEYTTYTWYKGDTWDAAKVTTPVQAAKTNAESGRYFHINPCALEDAGTYWCSVANGACEAHASVTVTVVPAGGTKYDITYNNTKGATNPNPAQYTEGVGVASFTALSDVDGFHFTGWNPPSIAADASGHKTINATWVPTYNVSFDKGAGTGTAPTGFQKWEGATFDLPGQGDMVAPSGRVFGGWKVGVSDKYAAGDTYTMGTTSVEFIAQWDVLIEQVIYSWEGAEGGATEVGGTVAGSTTGLINQLSAGYYCLKIDGNNSYSGNLVTITLSGEEKVKTGDKITYWGFYNKSSSANARPKMRDANSPNAQIFDDGTNLPNLYSGGDPAVRTFTVPAGINTNAVQLTRSQTGSNTWIPKIQITREKAVPEEDLRTVTFNTNGGSSIAAVSVEKGTAVAKPADPTKAHCRFEGWQLSGSDYNFSSAVNSNITLDAVWTQLYTISFAAGEGGSGDAPAAIADKEEGETFAVPANTFTAPEGKEFDKWNDGSNDYAPGATYTVGTTNVVLTAQWKAMLAKYTVIFKDGETELGTKLFDVSTNPSDADIDKTKPLFTFAAWQKEGVDIALDDAFWATVAKDATVTLTARWAKAYGNNVDFEAYIHANNSEKDDVDKAEAYVLSQNYALSTKTGTTFDANSSTNNGAYEGLKIKNSGTVLSWNVAAGKVVEFKAGVMVANGSLSINGGAATTIDGGTTGTGDNFKIHYFYSAAEALYEFTTSNGSAEVVKAITMRDPYQVSFDPNEGDPVAPQYGYPSVTLPDATNGTASLIGWFDDATAGNKIGDAGQSYTPTANITLYAHWEAVSTDHTLSDLKVGGVTVDGFDPAVNTYYVVLPYGTAVEDIPAISATANSAKAKQVAIQQAVWTDEPYNCYRAQANVQAEDESWGYYDVRFSFAPKDGVSLIKVATTGGTNKTVTGVYAGDGDVSLSSSKKMDNGKYIGFTLDGTTLQAGDRINVHTSQAANTGGSHIIFYDNMTDKNELYDTEEIGGEGDNIFTINAAMVGSATAYVYRANNDAAHQWNGYVDYIEVTRAMNPVMTAIVIDGRDGEIDALDDKHFSVTIPYESDLVALTVVPTVIRNAAHATTPEAVISNEGAWILGDNTYRVMDKDGDYTDYTITLDRDVLKHTVSFNTHGGSAVASELVVDGESLAAAPADPTKDDYLFQGWAETEDGSIVDVTSFAISADKEFHAVWVSDGGIKLLDGSTVNHANFITAVTATETVEFKGDVVNYAKFSGTVSGVNGVKDLTRVIAYNATTNKTKIQISAHNNSTSARSILVKGLVEGANAAVDLATIALGNKEDKVSDWIEFDNAANRTIYIMVSSSAGDVYFTQVKVIESGETPMKQVGEAGYSLNLNKGRFFGTASTDLAFEGLNARLSGDYTALNSGYAKLTSTSMSFTVAAPMLLKVTTNNNKTYYVTKGAAGSDNETAKAGVSEFDLTAGTWYITAGAAEVQFTNIAFELPKCEKPVITTEPVSKLTFDPGDMTATVVAAEPTEGTLSYQWYNADGDAEVVGATEATLTTTTEGTYYVIVTNSLAGHQDNSTKSAEATLGYRVTNDATLSALSASAGTLSPAFDAEVIEYHVNLPEGTIEVPTLSATATMDGYANVQINDAAAFENYEATSTVVVTSEDGTAQKTYTVNFLVDHQYNVLVNVTGNTTWNWTGSVDQTIDDVENKGLILANYIDGENFEKIEGKAGEYARRNQNGGVYQGTHLHFNTTVAGKVKFYFRAPSSGENCTITVKNNGKEMVAGTRGNSFGWSKEIVVKGDVVIEMENDKAGGGTTRVQQIVFTEATPDYSRSVSNNIGTLCVDHNVPAGYYMGATFYQIASRNEQYNDKIDFEEVLPTEELKAGEPYIFQSTTGRIDLFFGETAVTEPVAVRGMIGAFADATLDITEENKSSILYIASNKLWNCEDLVGVGLQVVANRAYIDMAQVPTYADYVAAAAQVQNPAPRRRVTLGRNGENTATGIEMTNDQSQITNKVLVNGQLFIIRGEKMFDATGRLVK